MIFVLFEEILDKLFQERSNVDASLAALLELSQLVCFTYGILVSRGKSKSTKIQAIFQGALSISLFLLKNTQNFEYKNASHVGFGQLSDQVKSTIKNQDTFAH